MALIDDPIGRAVYDYHFHAVNEPIVVHSEDFDDDLMDTSYLFRTYRAMPAMERKALSLCRGHVLDIGACAGAHTVYLQEKGFEVTAVENSEFCCKVLKDRGIQNVVHQDILKFNCQKFDTILLFHCQRLFHHPPGTIQHSQ